MWRGWHWMGTLSRCLARPGLDWRGKDCRQQHGAFSEAPCCSLWRVDGVRSDRVDSGVASAWLGTLRRGSAWRGKDCRRQYGGFSLPTVLSGTGMARHFAAGLGAVR